MATDSDAVSIVVPVHNEGSRVFLTLEAIRHRTRHPHDVVVVDDGSSDGCCDFLRNRPGDYPGVRLVTQSRRGAAVARNVGANHATADHLVFLDAHCFPPAGWLSELYETLASSGAGIATTGISVAGSPATVGYGLTLTAADLSVGWLPREAGDVYEVPAAGAGCMMLRAETFEAVGAFDEMRWFGLEDVELSIRCWLFGHRVVINPNVAVAHVFKSKIAFKLPWADYLHNVVRTAVLHFRGPRLRSLLERLSAQPGFAAATATLLQGDIWARRAFVEEKRVRSDAWYCERFDIEL